MRQNDKILESLYNKKTKALSKKLPGGGRKADFASSKKVLYEWIRKER